MALPLFFPRIAPVLLIAVPLVGITPGCTPSGKSSRGVATDAMTQLPLFQELSARETSVRPNEQQPAPIVEAGQRSRSAPAALATAGDASVAPMPHTPEIGYPVSPISAKQISQRRPTVGHVSSRTFQQEVLQADVPVLVDFYADWCGPCKKLAPVLDRVAGDTPTAKFVKVNIDENPQLASQYKVRSVPTLLVFREGRVVQQHKGLADHGKLQQMIE